MENLLYYLYIAVVILLSLSFHELAHGYVSYRLGDPTAKNEGRLTLNPLKHLEVLGTLMMIATIVKGYGFGWAKPVPINPMYYKNRKAGTMLVSLAGPVSNLLLALISAFPLSYIYLKYANQSFSPYDYRIIIANFCDMFFKTNIGLAIFNIIPVPPLDGSRILTAVLPTKQYYGLMRYESYIGIAFLILVFAFPNQFSAVMTAIFVPVGNVLSTVALSIMGLFV